jgi:hypothetical protein
VRRNQRPALFIARQAGTQQYLDNLASASVQGLVATGPHRGCRVLRLGASGEDTEVAIPSRRCAEVAGFNVHANTCARAGDRERLEHMIKYLARPPIANDRLTELPDGRLALRFKQAWRDGTTHVVFTPQELIEKLIPLIPRPRSHLVRYHGILGPAAKDRDKVVPRCALLEFGTLTRLIPTGDGPVNGPVCARAVRALGTLLVFPCFPLAWGPS